MTSFAVSLDNSADSIVVSDRQLLDGGRCWGGFKVTAGGGSGFGGESAVARDLRQCPLQIFLCRSWFGVANPVLIVDGAPVTKSSSRVDQEDLSSRLGIKAARDFSLSVRYPLHAFQISYRGLNSIGRIDWIGKHEDHIPSFLQELPCESFQPGCISPGNRAAQIADRDQGSLRPL